MTQGVQPDTLWWHWEVGWGVGRRLKREGLYIHLGLIHVIWQKPTQHCTAMIPQLKKKNLKWQQAHKDSAKYQNWSTVWKKARVGWSERIALKHVYYHIWNRLPVQVQCMRQGAQGWCTGMIQRDGMGREVGRGFKIGNTCTPMADSCQCMAKTTTIL